MDPELEKFFNDQVSKKKEDHFELKEWLLKAADNVSLGYLSMTTHPCTFTHPSARKNDNVTSIIAQSKRENDGYIRSGNVEIKSDVDVLRNAKYSPESKFLMLKMADGQKLLDHIENETPLAKDLLKVLGNDYDEVRKKFLKIRSDAKSGVVTSSKIKQVYFPIDDSEKNYHLLSVLTNSPILFELKDRLEKLKFGDKNKENELSKLRDARKENKYAKESFKDIYDLTVIKFGGSNSQNISMLNSNEAGKAYLLKSLPPTIENRQIRVPRTNFFTETINPFTQNSIFKAFHNLISVNYNNKNIREGRDQCIESYIDFIIYMRWKLREYCQKNATVELDGIPSYQRKWIFFDEFDEENDSKDWLDKIVKEIALSFINGYKRVLRKEAIVLNDELLSHVEELVEGKRGRLV